MRCIVCGNKMDSTTGGNYHCPHCGHAMNDLVYRPSNCDMPMPQGFGAERGWICPVCGRGLSPWTSFCPCSSNGLEITYGTNLGDGIETYVASNGGESQSTVTDINSEWNKYRTYTEANL